MKKTLAIMLGAAMMLATISASATNFYGVGQATYTNWKVDGINANDTIGAGFGVGLDLNSWAAVEVTYDYFGRGNISGFNQDFSADSVAVWAVVDPTIATVAGMPLRAVARVGLAYTTIAIDYGRTDTAFNDQALAYGFGAALGITPNSDIVVDYRHRQVDGFGVELDAITIGFKHSF